jgi:hypothetical protein
MVLGLSTLRHHPSPLHPTLLPAFPAMPSSPPRSQALPEGAEMHLQALLEGVAANARFPADSANDVYCDMAGLAPALSVPSGGGGSSVSG